MQLWWRQEIYFKTNLTAPKLLNDTLQTQKCWKCPLLWIRLKSTEVIDCQYEVSGMTIRMIDAAIQIVLWYFIFGLSDWSFILYLKYHNYISTLLPFASLSDVPSQIGLHYTNTNTAEIHYCHSPAVLKRAALNFHSAILELPAHRWHHGVDQNPWTMLAS